MKLELDGANVLVGDCREVLAGLDSDSVDSIVTDPPYELGFMGRKWDASGIAYNTEVWAQCLRVLKPGGHMIAFGGTRTWHRMAVAIEDSGFEIRDNIAWIYGSGFPKSVNLGDKLEGWDGWGTALKPAIEPIVLARKPIDETLTKNLSEWRVGGLNIDASRIEAASGDVKPVLGTKRTNGIMGESSPRDEPSQPHPGGRWPANVILDSDQAQILDADFDGVARYFYCPKASTADRNEGLDHLEARRHSDRNVDDGVGGNNPRNRTNKAKKNFHPTVKPTALMRYLVKLVTPPNGLVLDPFCGSGSTGKAALTDGFRFLGVELTEEYLPIIEGRLRFVLEKRDDDETLF